MKGAYRMYERLESRRLLSATLVDGLLTVTGTSSGSEHFGNDVIEVHYERAGRGSGDPFNLHVRLNGNLIGQFAHNTVSRVRVFGLAGHDRIDLSGVTLPGGFERGGLNVPAVVEGGAGNDTIIGGNESDTLLGGAGRDVIHGGRGADLIVGGAGNDKLHGDDGDDSLAGSAGNDGLHGGAGTDRFSGGRGIDTADYADRTEAVAIVIGVVRLPEPWPANGRTVTPAPDFDIRNFAGTGWREGDYIDTDVENAIGGRGNDVLWGSDAANVLIGGDGNDLIYGGAGLDSLYGGNGNDRLFAADNADGMPGFQPGDRVHGGAGNDFAMVDRWDVLVRVEEMELLPAQFS